MTRERYKSLQLRLGILDVVVTAIVLFGVFVGWPEASDQSKILIALVPLLFLNAFIGLWLFRKRKATFDREVAEFNS
jgi:uncharacterized membrane protein YqhA